MPEEETKKEPSPRWKRTSPAFCALIDAGARLASIIGKPGTIALMELDHVWQYFMHSPEKEVKQIHHDVHEMGTLTNMLNTQVELRKIYTELAPIIGQIGIWGPFEQEVQKQINRCNWILERIQRSQNRVRSYLERVQEIVSWFESLDQRSRWVISEYINRYMTLRRYCQNYLWKLEERKRTITWWRDNRERINTVEKIKVVSNQIDKAKDLLETEPGPPGSLEEIQRELRRRKLRYGWTEG